MLQATKHTMPMLVKAVSPHNGWTSEEVYTSRVHNPHFLFKTSVLAGKLQGHYLHLFTSRSTIIT